MIEHECTQHERLGRIETGVNDAIMRLAVVDERIKSMMLLYDEKLVKYDRHVEQGEVWRNFVLGNALALAVVCAGAIWWGGVVQGHIDRLTALHPYGSAIAPTYGTK